MHHGVDTARGLPQQYCNTQNVLRSLQWEKLAAELASEGSHVKVAKIDCTDPDNKGVPEQQLAHVTQQNCAPNTG